MAEYIEREKVLALSEDFEALIDDGADEIFFEYIPIDKVKTLPAADVRPVVRGKWTCHRTLEHDGEWWCTACGNGLTIYMGNRPDRYKFCPNCGAKMEER